MNIRSSEIIAETMGWEANDMGLQETIYKIRKYLEPRWKTSHQNWGPEPKLLSKHMCRYTCIFIKALLPTSSFYPWTIVGGRPEKEREGTPNGRFGMRAENGCWFDHCWIRNDKQIIDITADQFGYERIIIASADDDRYSANLNEVDISKDLTRLYARVEPWINEWTGININEDS